MHTASSQAAVAAVARTGPHIHLIIGPVGAGKSTFARQLVQQHRAVPLNLDDWMATLFSADRPDVPAAEVMAWYVARTQRCLSQIWKTAEAVLRAGTDVVLEIGLIQRQERDAFYTRMGLWADAMTVYVLDAPREVRRERVNQRNAQRGKTFSMVVPPHIFELASDLWQPPDPAECEAHTVVFVPPAHQPR